ncbi:MAG: AtpZ/AtpI family protein [Pseudomonadota bacterium]
MQDTGGVTDPDPSDRLQALQARIDAAKGNQAPQPSAPDPHSQAQLAWRMVIELVAGLGIGFGIGYGLDALLGTTPWLMIIFLFLGLAAGIQTMMRSANEVQRQREAAQAEDDDSGQDGPE